jgi:hypothetical protein
VVSFLAASAHTGETGAPRLQMSNNCGRLARALPLFLCEQLHLRTDGIGRVLQPFIVGTPGGFVLAGTRWDDDVAIAQARAGDPPGDYVVLSHFAATREPYSLNVRLIRTIDGSQLAEAEALVDPQRPERGFTEVAEWLLAATCDQARVTREIPPPVYEVPHGDSFSNYQLRLEQALAVAAGKSDAASPDFLSGEREIVMGMLQLCLDQPGNVTTRLLLASTLQNLKEVRPEVVFEFRERVELLQKDQPLAQGPHDILQGIVGGLYLQ